MSSSQPSQLSKLKSHILNAGVRQEGHYIFADGGHGLVKLEMDALWENDESLSAVLEALVDIDLPPTDLIMGVPSGGQLLAEALIERKLLDVPIVRLEKVPHPQRKVFRFSSPADAKRALSAKNPRIYEDVVSTMSSIAGVTDLLDTSNQKIQVAAIWRRGEPLKKYAKGIHKTTYLIEKDVPIYTADECPECAK